MTCPDSIALARAGTQDADPAVVAHLKNCPSCWLDWQIQQGARYALHPDAQVPPYLNERAIARIEREARELEESTRWWDLPILGALTAIAIFAFFLASEDAGIAVPLVPAAVHAIAAGVVAALYTRYREIRESRGALAEV